MNRAYLTSFTWAGGGFMALSIIADIASESLTQQRILGPATLS